MTKFHFHTLICVYITVFYVFRLYKDIYMYVDNHLVHISVYKHCIYGCAVICVFVVF